MDLILGIILGIIVLTLLVAAHEFGHGVVARRNGVKVEEFGIGFPPKVWGKKITRSPLGNDVLYTINWLPLGGFVKLKGEHDDARTDNSYGSKTFWQKTKILLAGVAVNWIVAILLFTILAFVGLPKIIPNQFMIPADTTVSEGHVRLSSIVPGLPADIAGLKAGDSVMRFNGLPVTSTEDLTQKVKDQQGKTVEIIYSRSNMEARVSVAIRADNTDHKGYLGAGLNQQTLYQSTWSAPIVGVVTTLQLTGATFQGLGDTIAKTTTGIIGQLSTDPAARSMANDDLATAGDSVAGPIGIFGVIFPAAQKAGMRQVVLLTAIISLTLAVMNTLPIPGLDGGRWFLTALFRFMKRPLTEAVEAKINGIGMTVLMALIIVITITDIGKIAR
jgi:regulator of sigma E protease